MYDHSLNELRLNNDWGRVCRPLYVVEDCQINLTKGEIRELKVRPPRCLPLLCLLCLPYRTAPCRWRRRHQGAGEVCVSLL